MDPNSSPWAYAYNRIVPSASGSSDDFQHTHLAQISAAAGSSAQSLLLQAAHSSIAGFNATSGNFVPPTPIGGYNPVFQQIYHHAAQAAVQPKPAHYASSAVSTSHRHLGLSGTVEKQELCRSQPAALGYTTNQSLNIPTSSYYGENSSSSGASPSPTTSATSSTTLSWNTPVIGTPQQMSANTFLTMHQQQQQAQQQATINQEKVINSKQSNLQVQMKAHSKNYEDLIYVGNHQSEHEENTLQLDNQIIQAVSEEDCARSEEGFYTFVDGKLSYNIPAAAISSASLPNKMPVSSIKVVTPRKHSSSESHHPALQQGLRQIPSPAYPIYESPSLCSSVGSPPPAVNSVHNNETANNSSHNNVYKSNTPTQQAQTSLDVSNVGRGANSNSNRSNNFARNSVSNSSLSPTTSVGYSSVITSAFQAQQQQQLQQEHHQMQQSVCWPGSSTNKLSDISKHDQKVYSIHSPHTQENNIYILPPSLQIKRTIIETVQQSSELPQASPEVHHQMVENALHAAKQQPRNQLQQTDPQHIVQNKQQHSVENVLATNNAQASQIQNTTKVEEVQKPIPTKKAPRKRQPKKTLLQNNDFSRSSQQNAQPLQQPSRQQQQQQQIQHHQPQQQQQQQQQVQQQQQQQQQQQHNSSFYDYNNRWMQPKVENNINIPSFGNNQSQSQQTNPVPQPAHVQSSQTHPHISQISQYYPAFPQHVSTQYAACMSQNNSLYNLTPLGQDTQQEQQQQQNVHQNAQDTMQQQNTSEEIQTETAAESLSCKVIVPNIEDELHFLTTADPKVSAKVQNNSLYGRDSNNLKANLQKPSSAEATPHTYPPFEKKDGPGKKSAFMDSYLKFLQGERDESPPPLMKTGRKYNYQKPCMQKEYVNSNKRKSNDNSQSSNTPSVASAAENTPSPSVEGSSAPITNTEGGTVMGSDDGHKIKIISQTQILPKKRPQAQNMAAVIQQNPANSEETPQQQQIRVAQQQQQQYRQVQQQTQNFHQDPLALPQRREQSLRKAKARGINEIMQSTPAATDRDEPEEFADSDTDPVWTPQDDDSEDGMPGGNFAGKRKNRRFKPNASSKKKDNSNSALKDDTILENDNVNKMALVSSSTSNNISENTSGNAADNFKTGDFIVLRSDLVNDWPIIWQVDSKCILQKYESFCQNGKMFYRNMSKYASWNLDTKKLYIKAPVRIQVQSHTETIVEFMRSELLADDTEQFIEKIMEDYLTYRDHFEIYIQTMISQVLDPSFFSEINREKDEYFLSSVRTIDEIMENCKRKLLSITPWTRSVIVSIETWPQCHVFTEWGQNNVNQKNCGGCHQPGISVRFLLFGHPYNTNTMQTVPVDMRVAYEKDILLCRICAARADIFHKIAHEKYNLFAICTRRVGEHQKELPGKSSTDILNDLLAENNWVDELFRNMRSSWAEVESLERQKRFHEVSQ